MTANSQTVEPQPLLSLVNETIAYSGVIALKNVSLQINKGEKTVLLGPSGAGKSSLLKSLYRKKPSACAFIHQNYSLVPQLSTFHNIYMGRLDYYSSLHNLRNLIKPSKIHILEITDIANTLGLKDKLWTRIGELSGGQQQRVGIGRALYRGGDILMADEPISSLDAIQGREIMELITTAGKTVVSALHHIELSRDFFDRIIGLSDQRILFDLPTAEVTDNHLAELYA